jgi:dTDP-4-amino-4,6-dideoxygalactose transaminase
MTPADDLPALLGGVPAFPDGPPDWPVPDEAVRAALDAAWRDGSWGKYQGGHAERLERRLAQMHGVGFALACGSGTYAVELALRALKVGPGDEVVLAAYDYPGNFLAVHAVGATPVLADVAPHHWNLDVGRLAAAFTSATRAAIVSHLHGGLVPMRRLTELAAAHGARVVEDAAQAPGAAVDGKPAGAWGDAGVLSFGGSKLLTSGRGGALLTPHADVAQRARLALTRAGNVVCPLSELQAAVLPPQLERLAERNAVRRRRVALLTELLRDVPGLCPFDNGPAGGEAVYYKLGFRYDAAAFGMPRARLVAAMRAEGVALDEGFRALHVGRSPARFRRGGPLDEADRAHAGALVLHHPVLLGSEDEIRRLAGAVRKVHAHAGAVTSHE